MTLSDFVYDGPRVRGRASTPEHMAALFAAAQRFKELVCEVAPVGSAYITRTTDSDFDVLLLLNTAHLKDTVEGLVTGAPDLDIEGGLYDSDDFVSVRQGKVNLLFTADEDFFGAFLRAAETCRVLHTQGFILTKEQRIAVHDIIMGDIAL